MNTLVEQFNIVFPKYKFVNFSGSKSIIEHSNEDNGKFRELEISNINGFSCYDGLAAKMTAFPGSANNKGVLMLNCDSIDIFEHNSKKFLMFSELKSKFSTDEIAHAKDQLIGTYLNLIANLNLLQGFDVNNYHIFGVIASYKPTDEILSAISKQENSKSAFALRLNHDLKYNMPAQKCRQFYFPLNVADFTIIYIPVENGVQKYSVNIKEIIERF